MECEYKKNDGVMDYCINPNGCEYQNSRMIREERGKLGDGQYSFNTFPNCRQDESVKTVKIDKTIDSLVKGE